MSPRPHACLPTPHLLAAYTVPAAFSIQQPSGTDRTLTSTVHPSLEAPNPTVRARSDELFTEETMQACVATALKNGTYQFPHPIADKKTGKRYKAGLFKVLTTLVDKIKHEILFDEKLMPCFMEWLIIGSLSSARCIRHTGCEMAMELMVHLAGITLEIQGRKRAKEQLQSSKKKKDHISDTLSADAQRLGAEEDSVRVMMSTIFDHVFVQRYRDSNEEIRACCISALGRAIAALPSFLCDQHLKYLGWILNDTNSANVRLLALTSLQLIYKSSRDELKKLELFTSRFEERFYEMIKDVDIAVAIEAIRLVTLLHSLKLLTHFSSTKPAVLGLLNYNPDQRVWKALGPMLQLHLQVNDMDELDAEEQEEGGTSAGTGKRVPRESIAAGGAASLAKSPIVQLASLLLHGQGTEVFEQRESGKGALREDVEYARELKLEEQCRKMVNAMQAVEPALSNWTAYADVFKAEVDLDPSVEATLPILLHLLRESALFTNLAHDVAAEAMAGEDDDFYHDDGSGSSRKRKATSKQLKFKANTEGAQSLSVFLANNLGAMLQRFSAQASPLRIVLSLVEELRLSSAQATLNEECLRQLLEKLEKATLQQTDVRARISIRGPGPVAHAAPCCLSDC